MTCEQIVEVWRWIGKTVLAMGWTWTALAFIGMGLTFVNNRTTAAGRLFLTWAGIAGVVIVFIGTKMVGGTP